MGMLEKQARRAALAKLGVSQPYRTRLSETAVARAAAPGAAQPNAQRSDTRSAQETLRAEIEKQRRSELAMHVQKLYESERERARAAEEFSELILTRRGYQASSQVVSTANDMLQELLEMRGRK